MWHRQNGPQANFGIINSGGMNNVQNQLGTTSSSQMQQSSPADAQLSMAIAHQLSQLREALGRERNSLGAFDQCVGFLDLADEQNLDEPEGRVMAKGMLTRIGALCKGVPAVLQAATSAANLIESLQKATS
ncbi:hypothetical protein [Kitasatospora sp. LaBMicrA B282]|uniref:hypothetical protein n=1 Tax=Kitasatospora sp. LaBMicrA B282 TaxID=3420949 RepID=UPI003D14CAF5